MDNHRLNKYDLLLLCVFAYLIIVQLFAIWPFTIDDMYIPLRYAKNWVAGEGLVWNPQTPPVEGYSSFSFVVLGAIALLWGIDPIVFLKAAGCVGLIFTVIAVYWIARFNLNRQQAFIPCIGLLLYVGQIIWAASGLETAVYEALLCGAVYCAFRGMGYRHFPEIRTQSKPRWMGCSGSLLAIAGMTRPEAPAFMLLFFILICWDKPAENENYYSSIRAFVLPLILIFLPYFIWRWQYYGYLFPNPIYCKGLTPESGKLDLAYLKMAGIFLLLSVSMLADKRSYFLFLPSVVYLILLAAADPVVAFFNRLFLPAFALLLPLAAWGLNQGIQLLKNKQASVPIVNQQLVFVIISFIIYFSFIPFMPYWGDYEYFSKAPQEGERLRSQVVEWLNANTQTKDWVVLGDSGKIPYDVSANFIDSFCLNNKTMAHYPADRRNELFCEQVMQEKPGLIIITSMLTGEGEVFHGADQCLDPLVRHNNEYQLIQGFTDGGSHAYIYKIYKKM